MNVMFAYRCSCCGAVHDFSRDAMTCCEPEPEDAFCCGKCFRDFDTEADAERCCKVDEESITVDGENMPIISAAELEAAGQLRLPLPEVAL